MSRERIELSISSSYLEHWSVYDALREIYQNSFDRANEDSYAEYYTSIETADKDKVQLVIGNKHTSLTKRTLILGETTKANNKAAIGKFGEGYKLAILVLLRNNVEVNVRTGTELWEFKIEYSLSFETKVMTMYRTENKPHIDNLNFILNNFSKKMYNSYTQYNLLLQKDVQKTITNSGELLLDKRNQGKIFVGGLYICKYEGHALYGYNFKPGTFVLGRDRNIIAGVDADWKAAQVIVEAATNNTEVLANVADNVNQNNDTKYIQHFIYNYKKLASTIWKKFREKNPEGLPIHSEDQRKELENTYTNSKPVIVSEQMEMILRRSNEYEKEHEELEEKEPVRQPQQILEEFFEIHMNDNSEEERELFVEIIDEATNWRIK